MKESLVSAEPRTFRLLEGDSDSLSVGVLQLCSVSNVEKNLDQIFQLLENTPKDLDLISLPENCLFLKEIDSTPLPNWNEASPIFQPLITWAKNKKCFIHLGSVPLQREGKTYNTSLVISPDGSILAPYSKIHLFDVDVVGHVPVRESDNFAFGQQPAILELKGWKLGLSICYDLRFSELFYIYAKKMIDVLLIPSAFLVPTGKAHWHILTRARAIETQSYVLAAAQAGLHGAKRKTYGHSLIIDPWGEVLSEGDESQPKVLIARLEKSALIKVRSQIPMQSHRRIPL